MAENTPGDVHVPSLIGGKRRRHTEEYLTAYHAAAQDRLPEWQRDFLHQAALPRSGGAAGRRRPEHGPIEEQALKKFTPGHVEDMTDEELKKAWLQLSEWHRLAVKKKMPTDHYEQAASFVAQEMKFRDIEPSLNTDLGRMAFAKSSLPARLDLLPETIEIKDAIAIRRSHAGLTASCAHDALEIASCTVEKELAKAGLDLEWDELGHVGEVSKLSDYRPVYDLVLKRSGLELPLNEAPVHGEQDYLSLVQKSTVAQLLTQPLEKRIIWYLAAEPNVPDTYGHQLTETEIEDLCHRFAFVRNIRMEHGEVRGLNADARWPLTLNGLAVPVENYILPVTTDELFGVRLVRTLTVGSWLVAIYYPDDALWEFMRDHDHGVSWAGMARKRTIA